MARRVASILKPDSNIESVVPQDIMNECIEDRHLGDNEILPKKIATVEGNVTVPVAIKFDVTADASAGLSIFNANAPFKMKIVDVIVETTATVTSETVKLTNGTNDITNLVVSDTDLAVTRVGTIDRAYSTIAKGGSLKVVALTSAGRMSLTVIALKID